MNQRSSAVSAVATILLGALFIIKRGGVIGLAITVLGVSVLVFALLDFLAKLTNAAIVKGVVGLCILVFGWIFVDLAIYILAAGIILTGLLQISSIKQYSPVNLDTSEKLFIYARPAMMVVAGACLLLNKNGTIDWVFVLVGALLVIQGVMSFAKS